MGGGALIAARSRGFETLSTLQSAGYLIMVGLEPTEPEKHPRTVIKINGPEEPAPELAELIDKNRDALKAAAILSDPPAWLKTLFERWWAGTEEPVRLDNGVYMVRVSVKNIAAAVAAKIGIDPLEWHTIRDEVEEALGSRGPEQPIA
jgi:hypothetical protein